MATYKSTSPYYKTPVKDFYLDLWVPREILPSEDDIIAVVAAEDHKRPDRLAHRLYGTPNLFWVFWIRNKNVIEDPINDFVSGLEITIPSRDRIKQLL